jgi:YfiH family protein
MTQLQSDAVYPVTVQNLPAYRVRLFDGYPSLKHTILTRRGGVSWVPFHSLNLSISVGDDPHAVRHNAAAACRAVQTTPEQTVSCHLVHDADVLTIDQTNRRQVMGQADGLVTKEPGIYLFMRFGDCTPLLFYDPVENAVGLSHAGWRGTVKNAAGATVAAMQRLGCRPQNIIAVIGPSIGPCCYEVGPDVIGAVGETFVDAADLFDRRNGNHERAYFNMWAANHRQLVEAGVEQVVQSGLCTACRTDEFFSHRAEQGRTGRFGVILGLKENGHGA